MAEAPDEFAKFTDEQLRNYEETLYDAALDGGDTWHERDRVLWEMNRRGLMDRKQGSKE